MRLRAVMSVSLLVLASCRQLLGIDEAEGIVDAGGDGMADGLGLPECRAQRLVHVVAGTGGFAWFTLVWPPPKVITQFVTTFAYDNPATAKDMTTEVAHQLYARRVVGGRAVWEGSGRDPMPTVFVAGMNETHSRSPVSFVQVGGVGLGAAAAAIQVPALDPVVPALVIGDAGPYGVAMGAPATVQVNDVEGGVTVLASFGGTESQLRPSQAQLARYVAPGALAVEVDVATKLAFAANALRARLVSTVIVGAFNDDPHGAFVGNTATTRANSLALALDAFYADLATANEVACGRAGQPLSLADNVVMVVNGDTPKNSFDNVNWGDGTPGNANWVYVRSNGFTKPGWFGEIDPTTARTNWNPLTGLLDGATLAADSTRAAWAGAIYAIARGRKPAVQDFTASPFDGAILR
jgi:hypothetical protein